MTKQQSGSGLGSVEGFSTGCVSRKGMSRILTRGPKVGVCNICGTEVRLTEDHTPPKGCVRVTQVEMKGIVELLAAELPGKRRRVSQNGVKYRTLCHPRTVCFDVGEFWEKRYRTLH